MSRRSFINGSCRLSASLLHKHSFQSTSWFSQSLIKSTNILPHHHPLPSTLNSTTPQIPTSTISSHTHFRSQNPHLSFGITSPLIQRLYSSSPIESKETKNPNPNPNSDMKHQEIEGPTVEKDLSPLANETREVTHSLLKTMYNVSSVLAFLGLGHLALGAYTYASAASSGSSPSTPLMIEMCVISALAFGFPFSMAFMLRQSLKSMQFFQKMEQIGRLQILTCTMQISKHLRLFFLRLRSLSFLCLAGLSFSFLYSLSSSL